MNKFYKIHTVTADEHDIGKGLFTYSDFSIRLIAIYLSGKQNLRQIVETWLSAGEEYFTNKECNDKNSNYESIFINYGSIPTKQYIQSRATCVRVDINLEYNVNTEEDLKTFMTSYE